MAKVEEELNWSSIVRLLLILGAASFAFFTPILKVFPYINHRYLEWAPAQASPDSITTVVNTFVLLGVVCIVAGFSGGLVIGFLTWRPEPMALNLFFTLSWIGIGVGFFLDDPRSLANIAGLCACLFYAITRWIKPVTDYFERHFKRYFWGLFGCIVVLLLSLGPGWGWHLQMRPWNQFGVFRWSVALFGFEAYAAGAIWVSVNVFKKNPLAADPEAGFVIGISSKMMNIIGKMILWLVVTFVLLMLIGFVGTRFEGMWSVYVIFAAHLCLVSAIGISIGMARFLTVAATGDQNTSATK